MTKPGPLDPYKQLFAILPPGAVPKRVPLKLKESAGTVYVEGLKEVELPDAEVLRSNTTLPSLLSFSLASSAIRRSQQSSSCLRACTRQLASRIWCSWFDKMSAGVFRVKLQPF